MAEIYGRIVRIVDQNTIIINLGRESGVTNQTVFRILGEEEEITDPETKEVLGAVSIVKGRVKASAVHDRFTIATTHWDELVLKHSIPEFLGLTQSLSLLREKRHIENQLLINDQDISPWKALSEHPVSVGDKVEAHIEDAKKEIVDDSEEA